MKEHLCPLPKSNLANIVWLTEFGWNLTIYGADIYIEINFCPFCGAKLEN